MFVYDVLTSIGIKVATPIGVKVDNLGATFLSKNTAISAQTKHIDTRLKCAKESQSKDCGMIEIVFVSTIENTLDSMTENVKAESHDKHTKEVLGEKEKKN